MPPLPADTPLPPRAKPTVPPPSQRAAAPTVKPTAKQTKPTTAKATKAKAKPTSPPSQPAPGNVYKSMGVNFYTSPKGVCFHASQACGIAKDMKWHAFQPAGKRHCERCFPNGV